MVSRQYQRLDDWYVKHNNRERIIIFIVALLLVWYFWDMFFNAPSAKKRAEYIIQIQSQQKQILTYRTTINKIIIDAAARAKRQQLTPKTLNPDEKIELNTRSSQANTDLFTAIFRPRKDISFLSRKTGGPVTASGNVPGGKYSFQMIFESDYFAALNYLDSMERLPWCFYWDRMNYKVASYPTATVVINLHIVNT